MTDQTKSTYSLETARYNLSKRLTLLSTVLLGTIGTIYYFENDFSAYILLSGGVISFISYLITTRTPYYRFSIILCLCLLTGLNIFNLNVASNFHHIGDLFWVICIVTAGFFSLGKTWGIALTIVNLLIIYLIFYLVRTGVIVQVPKPYTELSQINFFINLTIGGTLFSILNIQFLKENRAIAKSHIAANEKLEVLNEEKTVMLKEIHHRVKNNLQIVTSLLRLQIKDLNDTRMENEFSEAIDRISAIAKIHDKMYNNKSLNQIDLSDYLEDLVRDLVDSYKGEKRIHTKITTNINSIPPKHLVPIALIFNELITNSVKHAFANQDACEIIIDVFKQKNDQVTLMYSDNGTWVEADDLHKSIGLELIDSFIDQLDGQFEINKTNGTKYTIVFSIIE